MWLSSFYQNRLKGGFLPWLSENFSVCPSLSPRMCTRKRERERERERAATAKALLSLPYTLPAPTISSPIETLGFSRGQKQMDQGQTFFGSTLASPGFSPSSAHLGFGWCSSTCTLPSRSHSSSCSSSCTWISFSRWGIRSWPSI